MVGLRHDAAVLQGKGVVMLAAAHRGGGKACAEFDPLDRRDTENNGSDAVFHTVKHRIAQSGGHTQHRALDHAAHGVALRARRFDRRAHLLSPHVTDHGEVLFRRGSCQLAFIGNTGNGRNAGDHRDPLAREQLQANSSGNAQRCGQAAGKVSAARSVLRPAVLHLRGEIRMAGARRGPERFVVL